MSEGTGISNLPAAEADAHRLDGAREVQTQLAIQRRILEAMAERDAELRSLRALLDERDEELKRLRGQLSTAADGIAMAQAAGDARTRAALRERWLRIRERLQAREQRIRELEARVAGAGAWRPAPEARDLDRPFAACTIACRNYLAQARALFASVRRHEPAARLYLLVLDGHPDEVEVDPAITVVDPAALPIPDFSAMSFKYGVVEFNTAVKPYFLSLLMREFDEEEVVYFDPDIIVMRRLDELKRDLGGASILLTPHITRPIPADGLTPSDQDIMISGAYNLGFIGVRRGEETERFLRWWEERLEDGCRIDVGNGLFTDQKWIDLVPGLFPGTRVLRDESYNVAFWNLHERQIGTEGDDYTVNGRPAAFFHISGFDPLRPDRLSKHQTRTQVEEGSGLERLLNDYAGRLARHGWEEAARIPYGYARFDDGVEIHPLLRKLYLELTPEQRAQFGDPFRTSGGKTFREWATRPRREAGGLSYFVQKVYEARIDLQEAFPDARGRDRDALVEWARTQGPIEMGYDSALVRLPDAIESGVVSEEPDFDGRPEPALPSPAGDPLHYDALVDQIRAAVDELLPPGATVLVVSRGDYRLVHLGGRQAWHFPRAENGLYAGYHPRESADAIEHLETLRNLGADFLLIPATSLWWLDFYGGFRNHLDERYEPVADRPDSCMIYDLRHPAAAPREERRERARRPRPAR